MNGYTFTYTLYKTPAFYAWHCRQTHPCCYDWRA